MARFIVGVALERVEEAELLVAVEADSIGAARAKACLAIRAKSQLELSKVVRGLDWEVVDDCGVDVRGPTDGEYPEYPADPAGYAPDVDLMVSKS